MSIVAEGVETDYDALMMNHLGCTEMQGFHFSKPIEAAQLTSLLERFVPRISPVTEVPQMDLPRAGCIGLIFDATLGFVSVYVHKSNGVEMGGTGDASGPQGNADFQWAKFDSEAYFQHYYGEPHPDDDLVIRVAV